MNHNLEAWFIAAVHAAGEAQRGGRGRLAAWAGGEQRRAVRLLDVPAPLRWIRWGFARLHRRAAAARRDGSISSA